MNIGILGCGWLGSRIAEKFSSENNIYTTTTSSDKIITLDQKGFNPTLVDLDGEFSADNNIQWEAISIIDVLIITVPFSLRKENDIHVIHQRVKNIATLIGDFRSQIFFISTTGVYPDENKCFTEVDIVNEKASAEYLFKSHYPQVNILRLGGLMGDNRQLGNYNVLNLDAPVNHVHFEDVILVIEKMINQKCHSALFNLVAPEHPTKREVICKQKNIPFVEKKLEGGKTVSSKKIVVELYYEFKHNDPRYFHIKE